MGTAKAILKEKFIAQKTISEKKKVLSSVSSSHLKTPEEEQRKQAVKRNRNTPIEYRKKQKN